MSNLSQFTGGAPVGSMMTMADLGPTVTLADNSVWLRSGTLTTAASAPLLANLSAYKVIGSTSTAPSALLNNSSGSSSNVNCIASNGSGVLILTPTNPNLSTIFRSTDNGVTWSAISVSGIISSNKYITTVAYGGGYFVAVYLDTGSIIPNTIYSTDNGATWAYGASLGNVYNCQLPSIGYVGSSFTLICQGYDGGQTYYSGWKSVFSNPTSLPAATSTGLYFDTIASNGGIPLKIITNAAGTYGLMLIRYGYTNQGLARTTNSGTTWTYDGTRSGGTGNAFNSAVIIGTKLLMCRGSKIEYWADMSAYTTVIDITSAISSVINVGSVGSYWSPVIYATKNGATEKVFIHNPNSGLTYEFNSDLQSVIPTTGKQLLGDPPVFDFRNGGGGVGLSASANTITAYDTNMTTSNYTGMKSAYVPVAGSSYYVRAS